MKNLLAVLLCTFSVSSMAGVSGNVGVWSDYFFRGESQSMGNTSIQGSLTAEKAGFYGTAWVGQVDGLEEANYEYDLIVGKHINLSDTFWVDGGVIQYRYDDKMLDTVEEWYVKGGNDWVDLAVYTDMNNSDNDYKEVNLHFPIVTYVDMVLRHGVRADESTYQQLTVSKEVKGWEVGMEVLDSARDGQFTDSAAFFLRKSF
jgi:uncharacterized protein (TIGR02001 family)|tara:strand:- start:128 stop:733 length:606 start_codon:yes stop_codon:yes gene_type:complete